ncbi:unnamed protein product [Mytilus coruscus]|uniref:Uncharacterized protein n=1 Tax=Mytilus coruscus TaxID=42192 RepID=A0A6J8DKB7_MYTCO|nr:unnamed protein product [Mytilus coruscus]
MEKLCPVAFGVIALLFLVAGAFSPGWMVFDSSSFTDMSDHDTSDVVTLHMGFFYLLIIGKDFSMSLGYGSIPDYRGISYMDKLGWDLLEYQIEVILGVVLCILSLILTLVYNRDRSPSMLLVPIITSAIAGGATGVAVWRWLSGDARDLFPDVAIAAYLPGQLNSQQYTQQQTKNGYHKDGMPPKAYTIDMLFSSASCTKSSFVVLAY